MNWEDPLAEEPRNSDAMRHAPPLSGQHEEVDLYTSYPNVAEPAPAHAPSAVQYSSYSYASASAPPYESSPAPAESSARGDAMGSVSFDNIQQTPSTSSYGANASESETKVEVSDPQHAQESSNVPGMQNTFVTYLVTTHSSLPSFSTSEAQVRRRFSDFVALEKLLLVTHRGYFIPPRPDKCVTAPNKLGNKFVDRRRQALQSYLQRLARHRVIGRSEELRVFLEEASDLKGSLLWQSLHPSQPTWVDGAKRLLFQAIGKEKMVPAPAAAAQSTKQSHDVVRQVKEYIHHVRHRESVVLPDREVQLRQHSDMVRELAGAVSLAAKCATTMQRSLYGCVQELGELGLAIGQLGHYEEANMYTVIGQSQKGLGQGCLQLNTLGLKGIAVLGSHTRVLDEQNRMMTGVLEALNSREEALTTLQTLEEDIGAKRARATQLQASGKSQLVHKVMQEVAAAEAARQAALAEYERVADRNLEELNQFVNRQSHEVAAALHQWAILHESLALKQYHAWLKFAKELGADHISISQLEQM